MSNDIEVERKLFFMACEEFGYPHQESVFCGWLLARKAALAAPRQVPVAWWDKATGSFYLTYESIPEYAIRTLAITPLYTAATPAALVLSDDEIIVLAKWEMDCYFDNPTRRAIINFARALLSKVQS
jgi:hypothetical protein